MENVTRESNSIVPDLHNPVVKATLTMDLNRQLDPAVALSQAFVIVTELNIQQEDLTEAIAKLKSSLISLNRLHVPEPTVFARDPNVYRL